MAHNVSHDEELLGILRDVATHHFSQGRQINPSSMLYRTIEIAIKAGYLENAVIEQSEQSQLVLVNLSQAHLSSDGKAKLAELSQSISNS